MKAIIYLPDSVSRVIQKCRKFRKKALTSKNIKLVLLCVICGAMISQGAFLDKDWGFNKNLEQFNPDEISRDPGKQADQSHTYGNVLASLNYDFTSDLT